MSESVWSGKIKMRPIYRYILLSGIAIWGTLMTMSIFYSELRFLPSHFVNVIHIPAEYIAKFWVHLELPPYGDAAIVIVPPIAFGLQWLIILVVVFFITRRKHKSEETSDKIRD